MECRYCRARSVSTASPVSMYLLQVVGTSPPLLWMYNHIEVPENCRLSTTEMELHVK